MKKNRVSPYARRKGDVRLPYYDEHNNRKAKNFLFRLSTEIQEQFQLECKNNKQSMSRVVESQMVSYIVNSRTMNGLAHEEEQ
jgi:hypothetical protein